MKDFLWKRLEKKSAELKTMQENFLIFVKEINTASFESNAISALLAMQKLKTEISELDFLYNIASISKE